MSYKHYISIGQFFLIIFITTLQSYSNVLSVRSLALNDLEIPEWYIGLGDDTYELLPWPTTQASDPIKTLASKELQLFTKKINPDGQSNYVLERKVPIPEDADEVLLLGWTNEDDDSLELLAIKDKYLKAKYNDWLLINRTDQAVTIHYGKDNEPVTVEPDDSMIYQINGEIGKGAEMIAETMIGDKLRKIFSTYWAAPDKQRSVVILETKNESIRLRRIIDYFKKD